MTNEDYQDFLAKLMKETKLTDDQKEVVEKYFCGSGRVCVDAGAGTGKTTTLIEILSFIIILEQEKDSSSNPFERILVISFTKEASRQMKIKIKERLYELDEKLNLDLSEKIYRWLETESFIQTIDSYIQILLKEIALEISLNPLFEVAPLIDIDELIDEIKEEMRNNISLQEMIESLDEIYKEIKSRFVKLPSLFEMITSIHQKSREFCWKNEDYSGKLKDTISMMFNNYTPPFSRSKTKEIIFNLTNEKNKDLLNNYSSKQLNELSKNLEFIYNEIKSRYEKIEVLIKKYDEFYSIKTKKSGSLTYIDIAYMLWKYLDDFPNTNWVKSLRLKFDHLLIDEFQDTSFVQCRIISNLIRNDVVANKNKIMIIGDVKQSIYQWRSAEPNIFSSIINYSKEKKEEIILPFDIKGADYVALTSNFRSTPDIIYLVNGLFSETFANPKTGRIGNTKVDYVPLIPKREIDEQIKQNNIHAIFTSGSTNSNEYWANWNDADALAIVSAIKDILNGTLELKIQKKVDQKIIIKSPVPGDFALLFRRRSTIPRFLELLDQNGIAYSLIIDDSLFSQHEISLLIDFLDWFANPHNKHALLHILRSPLIAISDETLRFLASENFQLRKALFKLEKTTELSIDENDYFRLNALLKFRNDLRWDREGEKAILIDKIINHGAMDIVLLSSISSFEALANIRIFIELIKEWEEEELLSYKEFVYKIRRLRERSFSGKKDYSTLKIGDYESKNSVKILTIHASKGLEFPIVIIPDLITKDSFANIYRERLLLERDIGLAIKPVNIENEIFRNPKIELNGPGNRLIPGDSSSGFFWIHNKRSTSGDFEYKNPLNNYIKKQISEYWRLFYVATTRAMDHLIFHLGLLKPRGNKYCTWMFAIQDHLKVLKNNFEPLQNNFVVNFEWQEEQERQKKSLKVSKNVEINILDPSINDFTPLSFKAINLEEEEEEISVKIKNLNVLLNMQFVPSTIGAKDLYNLLQCPRRYAYGVLNKIDNYYLSGEIGEKNLPPGSTPPKGIDSAAEWGSIVHQTMEKINRKINSNEFDPNSLDVEKVIANLDLLKVKGSMKIILENYFKDSEIKEIYNSKKSEIFTEYELNTAFNFQDYSPILVNGILDLLVQLVNDKWLILDYKTGIPPEEDSDLYKMYKNQLTTYVWLLKQSFSKIKDIEAKIIYVHPEFKIVNIEYDLEEFNLQLEDAIKNKTIIDKDQGFVKEPGKRDKFSRCLTCPYSMNVGGPCEE